MAAPTTNLRRLRGHKAAVLCCISSRHRPGVVVSSGEDGRICWHDLRCKALMFKMDVAKSPVSSICFASGNDDILYAACGTDVLSFDIQVVSAWRPLQCYKYNKEEINQVAFCHKSSFIASADDSGNVELLDTQKHCLHKTLSPAHTNICSSVAFLPWKTNTAVTGGLDAKLLIWDFCRGRALQDINCDAGGSSASKCFNPPLIHAIAVPDVDMLDNTGKICALAKGDGTIDLIDIEAELFCGKHRAAPKKVLISKKGILSTHRRLQFDYTIGGHSSSASAVNFSLFSERGRFVVSGGNDACIKLWDLSKISHGCCTRSLQQTISLSRKVNWLCTTPTDSENLVICDTSKMVKVCTVF